MKNTVACIQPSLAAVPDDTCSTIRLYGRVPKALAICVLIVSLKVSSHPFLKFLL